MQTTDIILHHYPTSPFAQKVRSIMGYKQLAWRSVYVPDVMPKPDVVALTGGFRKTPFMQMGADIYCDTSLICMVLDKCYPDPPLVTSANKGLARVLAQWADEKLFWAAMGYNFTAAAQLFKGAPPEAAQRFAEDRKAMSVNMTRLRPGDATSAYRLYLQRLAHVLGDQLFLLGEAPSLADFSAYHPLWFTRTRVPTLAGILDATPSVLAWMDRIAAYGQGEPSRFSAAEAIDVARQATPLAPDTADHLDDHGIPLGMEVTVAPESFGVEASVGTLVAATHMAYTLRRVDERAGTVHVHFPRVGYVLKKAQG
jgi:glutathione S-transferase